MTSETPALGSTYLANLLILFTAYLLILHTGSSAVLSPGVSGPVTGTCQVHPAGIKPEERNVNIGKCKQH